MLTAPLGAQPSAERPAPRTADGKPDMSGIWVATGAILLFEGEEAFAAARAADAAAGRPPGNSGQTPPYKPEAEAQRQYFLARQGIDDPMARCLLTGVPRIKFRPLPFEIVQLPDRVIMLYEIHHAFRIIPTDGRPPPEDAEPSYLGESVARWDGDTLVVDVTSFNDKTWLERRRHHPHGGVARHGALHARFVRDDPLRGDDGGSRGADEAVDDQGDVPAAPRRADSRVRVHREQRGLGALRALAARGAALLKKLLEPLGRRQLGKLRPRAGDLVPRRPSIPRRDARPVAAASRVSIAPAGSIGDG